MVPGLLNLPSMYFIRLDRVWYSSLLYILRTCVDSGPFTDSYGALARLVQYLMLRASALFVASFLLEYADWRPVIISVSLTFNVTCGNWRCSWVSRRLL